MWRGQWRIGVVKADALWLRGEVHQHTWGTGFHTGAQLWRSCQRWKAQPSA